jgi:hypothetical protein
MTYFVRTVLALLLTAALARAETVLQLYVEGSTYDPATESWTKTFTPGETIRIWAIGNTGGNKADGLIEDVHLLFAYPAADPGTVSFTLTPATTDGYGGFIDPSVAGPAIYVRTVTDGGLPTMPHGRTLPAHGEFGPGVHWQEFGLGDFTKTDSPLADFIGGFPVPAKPNSTQINAYELVITGTPTVHFDLYGAVDGHHGCGIDIFAPFSHDAIAGGEPVPEPGTFAMLGGLALVGAFWLRRRRLTSRRAT